MCSDHHCNHSRGCRSCHFLAGRRAQNPRTVFQENAGPQDGGRTVLPHSAEGQHRRRDPGHLQMCIRDSAKPGLRVYAGKEDLPKVLGGLGVAIISTNQGVVTDKKARELGVGGEVLAFVW